MSVYPPGSVIQSVPREAMVKRWSKAAAAGSLMGHLAHPPVEAVLDRSSVPVALLLDRRHRRPDGTARCGTSRRRS